MSISSPAQREDQQLEWIGGSVFSVLLDAEAPPFHLLLSGSALVWAGAEEHELLEGGMFRHVGRHLREPPGGLRDPRSAACRCRGTVRHRRAWLSPVTASQSGRGEEAENTMPR
ncbi:hypothetical protein [Streptomyces sp. GESEQ-4]|uniref:hypothetical protein n=1 Tax=Streptomyces sp. GESEQ-4 TaxID=2812655 RepID=UPI001FF0A931|nr:hypothetical protein [Streptomyces sp. GESEQ-4]